MNEKDMPMVPPEILAAMEGGQPVFYANQINTVTTAFDVRISFGKLQITRPPSYDVHVYLSLPSAKQLRDLLNNAIQDYEKDFGEIMINPKGASEK